MGFKSILWNHGKEYEEKERSKNFIDDLNLTVVIEEIGEYAENYDYYRYADYIAEDTDTIRYRQEILKDFLDRSVLAAMEKFRKDMLSCVKLKMIEKQSENRWQRKRWHLAHTWEYCRTIKELNSALSDADIRSEGLLSLREWLGVYLEGSEFRDMDQEACDLTEQLNQIRYSIHLKKDHVLVSTEVPEDNFCSKIQAIFRNAIDDDCYMENPLLKTTKLSKLEDRILNILTGSYPEAFERLDKFCKKYPEPVPEVVSRLLNELSFYTAFVEFQTRYEAMGLHFCFPEVVEKGKGFRITENYDLALAIKNLASREETVSNDFYYTDNERFLVITGPNQGGKTTFARAAGQLVFLSLMGLMVPARQALLPRFDGIVTHFSREESLETGMGKLKEELYRLRPMMLQSSINYFAIINELFTTATTYDAITMGQRAIQHFMKQGCYGIYVTHIRELAKEGDGIVSMVASLDDSGRLDRTFKVVRRQAEGFGYVSPLVKKYHLTYEQVKEVLRNAGRASKSMGRQTR